MSHTTPLADGLIMLFKNGKRCSCGTIELLMQLEGLLSTPEARVALGFRLVQLLRFFRA